MKVRCSDARPESIPCAPSPGSLLEAVLRTAARARDRVAVETADDEVTYGALASTSLRLAEVLRLRGAGPGTILGCVLAPGPEALLAALAAHACGASYAPLDPSQPESRLRDLVRGIEAAVTLGLGGPAPSALAGGWSERLDDVAPPAPTSPADVAYVVHTSGSTGQPKAVLVEHRNVRNTLAAIEALMPIGTPFRGSWWCGPAFDVAIWESWAPLLAGGTCVVVPEDDRWDGESLFHHLSTSRVQSAYLPATFLPDLVRAVREDPGTCSSLQRLLVGVEPIENSLMQSLLTARPDLQVVNGYGPAEAAICCLLHKVVVGDPRDDRLPIGHPLPGNRILLLDDEGRVTDADRGELLVVGSGVARGYLSAPGDDRFLTDPSGSGERAYRTGDVVSRLPRDGYRFEGRRDRQVKLRGHRIEPAEVEAALCRQPGVAFAAVVPREIPGSGPVLVGHVVPLPHEQLDPATLRTGLAAVLPAAWVPSVLEMVDALPLTPHGKTDFDALHRRALPAPSDTDGERLAHNATDLEALVLEVCRRTISTGDLDLDLGFVAAGGTSLAAQAAVRQLRAHLGEGVRVGDVLGSPTLRDLAERLRGSLAARSPFHFPAGAPRGRLEGPLSPAQLSIWLHDQVHPGLDTYAEQLAFQLPDDVDLTRLEGAIRTALDRHPAFSARLRESTGEVRWQLAAAPVPVISVPIESGAVEWMARTAWSDPCRLDGPLTRVHVVRELSRAYLLLQWHHLITDGRSAQLFLDDVASAYDEPGREPTPTSVTACDLAEDLLTRAGTAAARAASTRQATRLAAGLQQVPALAGSLRPGPEASISVRPTCPAGRAGAVAATPTSRVLHAFGQALHRRAPRRFVVGLAVSTRSAPGSDRVCGCLVDTAVVALGSEEGPEDLSAVSRKAIDAIDALELVPFLYLVAELRRLGELPAWFPEAYVSVDASPALSLGGHACPLVLLSAERPKSPLTLEVFWNDDEVILNLRAAAGVLSPSECAGLLSLVASRLEESA